MRFVLIGSLGALAAGCAAVGPDYEKPQLAAARAFGSGSAEPPGPEAMARWWGTFGDAQLEALVERMLSANLDLAAAVERIEVARAAFGIASADRFPGASATGGYQRGRPLLGSPTQDVYSVGGAISWELDLFGRVRRSVEASYASFEAQVEELHGIRVALVAEAVTTYLQALSLQERLDIAARNVDGQERSLEIANERFTAGMAAGLDPAQAEVNLSASLASVPALQLELRRALHRLAVLMGEDPRTLIDSVDCASPLPAVPSELLVGVPADLMRNRPDIRGLERQLHAQTARVGIAVAARYPRLDFSATWEWLTQEPDDLFDDDFGFGLVGIPISLPLFTGGRITNQIAAEEAAVRELHLRLQQQVLLAQEEVENALVAIVADREQVVTLDRAVAAARRSADLSRQLYTSGQSDFQNVLDAQRSLLALEDELARARLFTLLDLVELFRALGGGWGQQARVST